MLHPRPDDPADLPLATRRARLRVRDEKRLLKIQRDRVRDAAAALARLEARCREMGIEVVLQP